MITLKRRGFSLGTAAPTEPDIQPDPLERWHSGLSVRLKGLLKNDLPQHVSNIQQTQLLINAILDEQQCDQQLAQPPYLNRLEPKFESLGSAYNEGDDQEIEMVMFDAVNDGTIIAEDLWLKVSWLSFHDEDPSLRFRFSFGVDLEEDVAADPLRQQLSSELCQCVFPESKIITDNQELQTILTSVLNNKTPKFVERIVYFNAPNGGAYLHHDLERGHAGVVFAQITGSTYWLALPKHLLVEEIIAFSKSHPWPESLTREMRKEMSDLLMDRQMLSEQLDSFSNSSLIHLINETEEFIQFLIARGHSQHLSPGDVLLLPQNSSDNCCWHSVFCSGEEMGQALSFAIRPES